MFLKTRPTPPPIEDKWDQDWALRLKMQFTFPKCSVSEVYRDIKCHRLPLINWL